MAASMVSPLLFILCFFLLSTSLTSAKKTYIIATNHLLKPVSFITHHDWYVASLDSVSSTSDSLFYTYTNAFHGFAAVLDEAQVESLRKSELVLGVYEDTMYTLHTTRSPHFLRLDSKFGPWEGYGDPKLKKASTDIIIGVLDTGIWPESKSFDDNGMPAVPKKWRGKCESGPDFSPKLCNKKLIGARMFSKGYENYTEGDLKDIISPRDHNGHGTHTASTAAGSTVSNASLFGYARGTARGMAIHSRVASYKVCWSAGCMGSDIVAAMDQAIVDGVDVLSMSLGGGSTDYYQDTIAIGAFAAMEKGIFVSCSAGNDGPSKSSLGNGAPWIMTVGAGTIDRDFPAYVTLGNKARYTGVSLYSGKGLENKHVALVSDQTYNDHSASCLPDSLNSTVVQGKVVLCERGWNSNAEKGLVVRNAGGVGMIIANPTNTGEGLGADSHLIPAMAVGAKVGDIIREYIRTDPNPTVVVLGFGGTKLNVKPSPMVADFSSRGPSWVSPQIVKPDVIGPGVNILAAWPRDVSPTNLKNDTRKTNFNIISGTSMSCPHISGVAALIKAAHPDWSPSAIKSALMTTAYIQDNTNSPIHDAYDGSIANPWALGSGYIDPQKAFSPGLVYDINTQDYVNFLFSLKYSKKQIKLISRHPNVTCSKVCKDPGQLNYPSFSISFTKKVVKYTRTMTNVGSTPSTYNVSVSGPSSVEINVYPKKLVFGKVGEKKSYTVKFALKKGVNPSSVNGEFGSIVWADAQHKVRSPVSFFWTESGEINN